MCLVLQCLKSINILCIAGMDKLIEPLKTTVQSRVKANSVKQEFEKQEEMKRSAIRTVAALLAIPDAGKIIFIMYIQKNFFRKESSVNGIFTSDQIKC